MGGRRSFSSFHLAIGVGSEPRARVGDCRRASAGEAPSRARQPAEGQARHRDKRGSSRTQVTLGSRSPIPGRCAHPREASPSSPSQSRLAVGGVSCPLVLGLCYSRSQLVPPALALTDLSEATSEKRAEYLVKAMVFPVVMYGCESWTVKKAEH